MTQVYTRLSWKEKACVALDRIGHKKPFRHFERNQIPKIRKMAWKGASARSIIDTLGLEMHEHTFRRKCKELNIKLGG